MANSFRLMQRFWLDLEKPDENELAETIQTLKDERSFSRAIRQGLRLWVSLRQRDISVLFEMFPWTKESLEIVPSGRIDSNDSNGRDDQIKALQAKIDMLTDVVTQQGTSNGMTSSANQIRIASGIHKENKDFHKFPDGLLEIKTARSDARNNSSYNFMIASAAQVYGNYDALPPEIIAYGVETGRIPSDRVKTRVIKPKAANPKAMDVPYFDVPEFDDLDIQL